MLNEKLHFLYNVLYWTFLETYNWRICCSSLPGNFLFFQEIDYFSIIASIQWPKYTKIYSLLKWRLWHRCIPVSFAKFLKHLFCRTSTNGCFCLKLLITHKAYFFIIFKWIHISNTTFYVRFARNFTVQGDRIKPFNYASRLQCVRPIQMRTNSEFICIGMTPVTNPKYKKHICNNAWQKKGMFSELKSF